MSNLKETIRQYREAKLTFLDTVPVKLLPACPLNGIPVFGIDLSPEAALQLAKVRELNGQIKELERAFGN